MASPGGSVKGWAAVERGSEAVSPGAALPGQSRDAGHPAVLTQAAQRLMEPRPGKRGSPLAGGAGDLCACEDTIVMSNFTQDP